MNKTIEQLEQEKADILAKALKLTEMHRKQIEEGCAYPIGYWESAIAAIEALKPKPERLRLWVNVYKGGSIGAFKTLANAECSPTWIPRRAVPMIEVIPFEGEVPTWEEWKAARFNDGSCGIGTGGGHIDSASVERIADHHNAEMRRAFDFIAKLLAERGEG